MDIDRTGDRSRQGPIRHRNALLLACTALVALMPGYSTAQEANDGATTLETLIVHGSGTATSVLNTDADSKSIVATETTGGGKMPTDILTAPASVSVITSKEIQQRGASTVEEILQYTAGVGSDFYGSDDRFDYLKIRGFDATLYRDGLIIGRPFGGLREEGYAFERVEVLKGANSAGFGVSDPGGSVNFVTKRPKSERFGEAYISGGSFDHTEVGFDFGDNLTEDDTLSYRLTGKLKKADEEYDYSKDDERFFLGGLTWRPTDDTNVTITYDHLNRDGVPGSGGHPVGTDFSRDRFFGEPDYNFRGTDRDAVSVMVDHDFNNGLTFNANARYSKADSDFGYAYIASTPADGSTIADRYFFGNDNNTEQFIIDAHLLYEASFDNIESRTLVGAEYNTFKSDNKTYFGAAPGIDWTNPIYTGAPSTVPLGEIRISDQKTKGIYLQEDLTFFDRLTLSAGLRNDWLDLSEDTTAFWTGVPSTSNGKADVSEFTKRIGLSYKITDEVATYVSYADSVAPPATGVAPESGKQYEVGIKYRPDAFPALFTAAVYDLTKQNISVPAPITFLPVSVGKIRHRGVDLEAKAEVTPNIGIIAAYSYIDSEILENGAAGNEGNRLGQVPTHAASAWVTYLLEGNGPRGDMTFGLGARYTGAYYYSNDNAAKSKSNVVFDASYTYNIVEKTTLQLNVSNLFDEKHIAYGGFGADFYNPGRTVMATLRQTW